MKRWCFSFLICGVMFWLCGCTTPWVTNTKRSAIEQYLIATTIENSIGKVDFGRYFEKKAFFDYDYFDPQVDKSYAQGILEMQVAKSGIVVTRKPEQADIIIQVLCGVLGTDYNKFLLGTPSLPIPLPNTGISFAIPEIPIVSRHTRNAYGRFAINIFDAKTRLPIESISGLNASATYNSWIVLLIPFSTHNMDMEDTHDTDTTVEFFE